MKNKMKLVLSIFMATCLLFGCQHKNKKDDYELVQTYIEASVNQFKKAKIEVVLNSEDETVYSRVMLVEKTSNGSNYNMKVKELSDDLYGESLYKKTESNGTLNSEETKNLFPKKEQFKKDKILNFVKEEDTVTFKIPKENVIDIFNLKVQDLNKISDDGVSITLNIKDEKIVEYRYTYLTTNNLVTKIVGQFDF